MKSVDLTVQKAARRAMSLMSLGTFFELDPWILAEETREIFRVECHCECHCAGKIRKRMKQGESRRKNPKTLRG
jgi:hypothetical protein